MEMLPIPTVDSPLVFATPTTVNYRRKGGDWLQKPMRGVEEVVAEVGEAGKWLLFRFYKGAPAEGTTHHMVLKENVAELRRD